MAAALAARADAPIRVMIVDDSAVARAVMSQICGRHAHVAVVGSYGDAHSALAGIGRHGADVILLDIAMPGIDGLTALPDLLFASDDAAIIVVSATCEQGGVAAIQAMALGAADTLAKPAANQTGRAFDEQLIERITRLAREPTGRAAAADDPSLPTLRPFDILALSASTGGIHALSQMLRPIPAAMTAPILVTQHLPDAFMPYFAGQLALLAGRPATVAQTGTPVIPGRVLVAPGDAHMTVYEGSFGPAVRLQRRPALSGCCPSADPMLTSLADLYGAGTLAVTLSGMGRDGLAGAHAVRTAGGQIIVQDAESAVIWGMPGAVSRAGLADAVLPPAEIGALIARSAR